MDTSLHTLPCLFAQLGLNNSTSDINIFIKKHKGLQADLKLSDANFWNTSQASFINEAIKEDADWTEIIDQLDVQLR